LIITKRKPGFAIVCGPHRESFERSFASDDYTIEPYTLARAKELQAALGENPAKQYGVCRALDQQPIEGTDLKLEANPACVCVTSMQAMFCATGHMLECHYPMTCSEANCSHLERYREDPPL